MSRVRGCQLQKAAIGSHTSRGVFRRDRVSGVFFHNSDLVKKLWNLKVEKRHVFSFAIQVFIKGYNIWIEYNYKINLIPFSPDWSFLHINANEVMLICLGKCPDDNYSDVMVNLWWISGKHINNMYRYVLNQRRGIG